MRSRKTGHIGVLIYNSAEKPLDNFPLYEVILGADTVLSQHGFTVTLVRVSDVESMEAESRVFREHLLEGMIVMDRQTPEICARAEALLPACIFAEATLWRKTDCIRRDEDWTGRSAVGRMVEHGYSRILWFGMTPEEEGQHFSVYDRFAGAAEAAALAGVPLTSLSRSRLEAGAMLREFLSPGTGVVTYCWVDAMLLALEAGRQGLVYGRDFGLVSCEDSALIGMDWPALSRIAFDRFELGRQAAFLLLKRLKPGVPHVPSRWLRGEWIEGGTVGRGTRTTP